MVIVSLLLCQTYPLLIFVLVYSRIDWERAIHRHRGSTQHHQSYAEIQQVSQLVARLQ